MILLDYRSGSKDLLPYIQALTPEVLLTELAAGDVAWTGNGPDGSALEVGVEYKIFTELLKMIGGDARFVGHQVEKMLLAYNRNYLLIRMGTVRIDRITGHVQWKIRNDWEYVLIGRRRLTSGDIEHWFNTIEEFTQFRVKTVFDEQEAARWLVDRHSWYVNKGWDDHAALKQFHVPPPPTASFLEPGIIRRVAKEFKGIRWDRSLLVEARFKSVREMINANKESWLSIKGIGEGIASSVIAEITEERK